MEEHFAVWEGIVTDCCRVKATSCLFTERDISCEIDKASWADLVSDWWRLRHAQVGREQFWVHCCNVLQKAACCSFTENDMCCEIQRALWVELVDREESSEGFGSWEGTYALRFVQVASEIDILVHGHVLVRNMWLEYFVLVNKIAQVLTAAPVGFSGNETIVNWEIQREKICEISFHKDISRKVMFSDSQWSEEWERVGSVRRLGTENEDCDVKVGIHTGFRGADE